MGRHLEQNDHAASRGERRTRVGACIALVVLVGTAFAWSLAPDLPGATALVNDLDGMPILLAGAAAAGLILIAVPSPVVIAMLGAMYGPIWGASVALAAVVLAGAINLVALRRMAHSRSQRIVRKFPRMHACLRDSAIMAFAALRVAGTPLIALAALGAMSRTSFVSFASGVAVGSLPRTLTYATFGGAMASLPHAVTMGTAVLLPLIGVSLGAVMLRRAHPVQAHT